jgi:hypothetical protein
MATALISAGASLVGAALTSSAASKASKRAQSAADANTALAREQYDQSRAQLAPFVDPGGAANARMAAFLGLGGDEAAAHQAFQDFLGSTGYQFQLDQGARALTARKATQGLLNSGSTLKALQDYGQNTARSAYGGYLGQLDTLANRGANAAANLAGAGQAYVRSASDNANNAMTAANQAAATRTSSLNGLLGSALGAYGDWAGANAYQTPKFKF